MSTTDSNTPDTEDGTSVLSDVREFVATHHDVSALVREAQRFSLNLPLIGKVSVPPPRQLAVYGVIGALGATGAIEWPIALALGLGVAVAKREFGTKPPEPAHAEPAAPESGQEPATVSASTITVDGPAVVVTPTAIVVSPSVTPAAPGSPDTSDSPGTSASPEKPDTEN